MGPPLHYRFSPKVLKAASAMESSRGNKDPPLSSSLPFVTYCTRTANLTSNFEGRNLKTEILTCSDEYTVPFMTVGTLSVTRASPCGLLLGVCTSGKIWWSEGVRSPN